MNRSTGHIYALGNGVLQESPPGWFCQCPARAVTVATHQVASVSPASAAWVFLAALCEATLVLPPHHDSRWQVLVTPFYG